MDDSYDRHDLVRLKAERDAADRAYNEALTRLDRAIERLPTDFPHPPPSLDEHQITPLNALWEIRVPPAGRGLRGRLTAAVRRMVEPLVGQQQAFNSAVVDHLNRNIPVHRQMRESIESTLVVLRDHIAELVGFQTILVVFLQQITPYVDTRDRDVAGVLAGLSGAINTVSDEVLKRSEALLTRQMRNEIRAGDLESKLDQIAERVDEVRQALERLSATERRP